MTAPSILIVCSANICRSPVAEALLREKLEAAGHGDVTVTSGGTLGLDGAAAASHSVALLAERGLDLRSHRSRSLDLPRLEGAALILGMEEGHVELIRHARPALAGRIARLADLAGEARDVPDPYGGPRSGYETMVADVDDLLERALPRILAAVGRAG
ncbi:MAG: low molecular weight protein-tyrosine-phosphatase [Acidobacteriota bacterium]